MEYLSSFLAAALAFIGSIIGNVMANDLCVSAPRTCTFIIQHAARRLGKYKGRYEEEWLAHLAEQETVYEKYRHAIGCYLSVGPIRRQAKKVTLYVEYTIPYYGPVEIAFNLSSQILAPLWFAAIRSKYRFLRSCGWVVGGLYFGARLVIGVKRKHPTQMAQFVKFATAAANDKSIADWPFEARVTKNGRSMDFTKVGQTIKLYPHFLSETYDRMRVKKVIER